MSSPSGTTSDGPDDARRGLSGHGLTLLALSFAAGIALGAELVPHAKWPLVAAAGLPLALAARLRVRAPRASALLLMASALGLGAAWCVIRLDHAAPDDMAAQIGDGSTLVQVRGIAEGPPSRRDRAAGSMGRFDYRPVAVFFPLRVQSLIGSDGRAHPARGQVYVSVAETLPPFRAGDRIEATGHLSPAAPPSNPGEFDYAFLSRAMGRAGTLSVPTRDLVVIEPVGRLGVWARYINWRAEVQRRAGGWLLGSLPRDETGQRDALLAALLLGQREREGDDLADAFQRVGLAHMLAISGLHLGVLAGFVLLLLRLLAAPRRGHGWLIIVVVLGYLVLVEVRMPVLRAGVMTIASSLALIFGRRLRVGGLIALSAIGLLAWRPDQLFTPGFQLSFGVVLGIVYLAPLLRQRWFGRPDLLVTSTLEMLGQWLRTTLAVTVSAWLVAAPITAYHFGVITPMGVPMSVVALPLVAVLLALGYLKMVLTLVLPSAALLLGLPLSVTADVLLSLIGAIDELPAASWPVPPPSAWWTAAALGWVVLFAITRDGARRRWLWAGPPALALWLLALSAAASIGGASLRIDMLAVGDGSCYVVRCGGRAALFDAGSSTDLDAGRRLIVPALRRLNVGAIDFIAISHANFDHYSAALEIVDAFRVEEVLVTPHFLADARRDLDTPPAYLLDQLAARFVRVGTISGGDQRMLGPATLTWLHPGGDDSYRTPNDSSMVLRIDAEGGSALLCGDIQAQAMARLLAATEAGAIDLRADVLEMPHHGSFSEIAVEFVRQVDPRVLLQSTGWRRWSSDRWATFLAGRERLVTVRDGACGVGLDGKGGISVHRYHPRQ